MKIEYRLNLKDYQEANKFHSRTQKFNYWLLWIISVLLIFSSILHIVFLPNIYSIFLGLFLGIILNPEFALLRNFFIRLAWKNQSNAVREPVAIEITEEGIAKEASSYSSLVRWPVFSKFLETPNLFIVYEGKCLMHIIPKRSFSGNEQIQEFKAVLNEKLERKN
jgi:YcxB-like protein